MNHLFYVEHTHELTKMGFHTKGIYTAEEVAFLKMCGQRIYRMKRLVAKCKGQEVEIRRNSLMPHESAGVYGVGVECVE